MKAIIFLLSFMFLSCVTANPEGRDLSAVNTEPELSSIDNQFKACVSDCTAKGGLSFWCSDSCLKTAQKENTTIKVADYARCMYYCERAYGDCPEKRRDYICNDERTSVCHSVCRRTR